MTVGARFRFAVTAAVLAAAYFFLLVNLIGWISACPRPGWWVGAFPTRRMAAITWLIALHTSAVLSAALPVAVAAVVLARQRAVQMGLVAAALATAAGIIPSLSPTIWPIIWSSQPVFFVTDQIKFLFAVPFIAWVIRGASSNDRFQRSQAATAAGRGGNR